MKECIVSGFLLMTLKLCASHIAHPTQAI